MTPDQYSEQDHDQHYDSEIDRLKEEVKRLEAAEKKAFWWSVEFTKILFDNKIQYAWEHYKETE